MASPQFGERNPFWKGGRSIASNGYVLVRVGEGHHLADVRGYAYEHRVEAEKKLGRRLLPGEQVHHIDGNKQNNAWDNLEVMESSAHHQAAHRRVERELRWPGEPNPIVKCACGCGETFPRYDSGNRPRTYVSGHNPPNATTVLAVLAELRTGPKRSAELAQRIGAKSRHAVPTCLSKLKRSGHVRQLVGGRWELLAEYEPGLDPEPVESIPPTEYELQLAERLDDELNRASASADTIEQAQAHCVELLARRLADYRDAIARDPAFKSGARNG